MLAMLEQLVIAFLLQVLRAGFHKVKEKYNKP